MNKPFLLFTGKIYYPNAGWKDFAGAFSALGDAEAKGREAIFPKRPLPEDLWYQVVDLRTMTIVSHGESDNGTEQ